MKFLGLLTVHLFGIVWPYKDMKRHERKNALKRRRELTAAGGHSAAREVFNNKAAQQMAEIDVV